MINNDEVYIGLRVSKPVEPFLKLNHQQFLHGTITGITPTSVRGGYNFPPKYSISWDGGATSVGMISHHLTKLENCPCELCVKIRTQDAKFNAAADSLARGLQH